MNTNYSTLYDYRVELVILLNPETLAQEQEYYEYAQEYCEASLEVQEVEISLQPPPFHLALLFVLNHYTTRVHGFQLYCGIKRPV